MAGNLVSRIREILACGIQNPALWNPEFNSRNPESLLRLESWIPVPLKMNLESGSLVSGIHSVGRGTLGVPNTAIPYDKFANTEIPCRKWMKYRYRIYDRWRLLNVVSTSCVHVYARNQPQPSRENVRRSRIDRYNDRKARSLDVLPHHRVTVRNCVFIYR